jgi:hypothetical protein
MISMILLMDNFGNPNQSLTVIKFQFWLKKSIKFSWLTMERDISKMEIQSMENRATSKPIMSIN